MKNLIFGATIDLRTEEEIRYTSVDRNMKSTHTYAGESEDRRRTLFFVLSMSN